MFRSALPLAWLLYKRTQAAWAKEPGECNFVRDIAGDPSANNKPQEDRLGEASRNENFEDNLLTILLDLAKRVLSILKKQETNTLDFRLISS